MKFVKSLLLFFSVLLISCSSNVFTFDEEKQEVIATDTYFSCLEIREISSNNTYILKSLPGGRKIKSFDFNEVNDCFQITSLADFDTISSLSFNENSKYEIINRGIRDAAACKMILVTDSVGLFHKM